ncbi:tRNA lysidine(34) synthetase TilS [Alteromonas sp. a30]|uniref:tRNA lysidine(34) synthetase TilS n=1 Tax=Alteromonas sp. a30 TaxID=2730917 RepID=UPI00228262CE|nr:tRNA lysidine(34) synthetase TilS [Alteromonas sp. a30]MCY7294308.1 tRNA lysidine(34) synthetase TilS [Alteromonas sp. a30]
MISLYDFECALAQSVFPFFQAKFKPSANTSELLFKNLSSQQLERIKLVVAYSGGVDSQVLLHLCMQLKANYPAMQLRALHVNHGLSINADKWTQHCRDFCHSQGIGFESQTLSLQKQARKSLEAEARNARYQALSAMMFDDEVLLLGQHQQDQVETFLLQLKRGAGPKGLASMAAFGEMSLEGGVLRFARPLLNTSKADIFAYAETHQLHWIEDESNQNRDFDRNFLRHEIMPELETRWSAFVQSAARSVRLIAEQEAMLNEVGEAYLMPCLKDDGSLCLTALNSLSVAWQKWVIRVWVKQFSTMSKNGHSLQLPSEKTLNQILHSLVNAKEDANPKVMNGEWSFRRFQARLFLVENVKSCQQLSIEWRGEKQLTLPEKMGVIHFDALPKENKKHAIFIGDKDKVSIYFRNFSSRFKPKGSPHSKPLKQWFKQWQTPPWERERIPLVYVNGELAMVGEVVGQGFEKQSAAAVRVCYWSR